MTEKPVKPERAEREARRAEALRANLKRRKAGGRKEKPPAEPPAGA